MGLTEEVDLLRKIPLFANIETAKLKLLAFTAERLSFDAGDELCREGEPGDSAFVIVDGEAEVAIRTPAGPKIVAKVGKHDFVGEIAILCDMPRTATVRALTPVVTLSISKDLFLSLVSEFPQMAVEMLRILAQRLQRTTQALVRPSDNA